jgi:pimeloyl-ACP methyl ester carboxylesterase
MKRNNGKCFTKGIFLILFIALFTQANAQELHYPIPCTPTLKIPAGENISCGYLGVPERHKNPDGRQIQLFFMIAKSLMEPAKSDPIFYLIGGPGLAVSKNLKDVLLDTKPFRTHRAFVMIDQRGTGYSKPQLKCEVPLFHTQNQLKKILQKCQNDYSQKGIDTAAYNTVENAEDIMMLAQALQLSAWNIIGESYGTRLALAIMQLQPQGLRSVVLDSAFTFEPLDVVDLAKRSQTTYRRFFATCKKDPDCLHQHPDLFPHFKSIVDALPRLPTDPDKLTLTSYPVISITANRLIGSNLTWKDVPNFIELLYHAKQTGQLNLTTFKQLLREQLKLSIKKLNIGMKEVLTCYDDMGATTPEQQAERLRKANLYYPYFQNPAYEIGSQSIACQVFGYGDALAPFRKPLTSQVPTMLLHGNNDFLPLKYDREIASQLPNAAIYQFSQQGHCVTCFSSCARHLVAEFYDAPNIWPVKDCTDDTF